MKHETSELSISNQILSMEANFACPASTVTVVVTSVIPNANSIGYGLLPAMESLKLLSDLIVSLVAMRLLNDRHLDLIEIDIKNGERNDNYSSAIMEHVFHPLLLKCGAKL